MWHNHKNDVISVLLVHCSYFKLLFVYNCKCSGQFKHWQTLYWTHSEPDNWPSKYILSQIYPPYLQRTEQYLLVSSVFQNLHQGFQSLEDGPKEAAGLSKAIFDSLHSSGFFVLMLGFSKNYRLVVHLMVNKRKKICKVIGRAFQ